MNDEHEFELIELGDVHTETKQAPPHQENDGIDEDGFNALP